MLVATGELLSPREAGEVLGFSRQHVRRLIDAGELEGTQLPGSEHSRISAASVEALLARRARARPGRHAGTRVGRTRGPA
jgi:excisionase family DNA binding protein